MLDLCEVSDATFSSGAGTGVWEGVLRLKAGVENFCGLFTRCKERPASANLNQSNQYFAD